MNKIRLILMSFSIAFCTMAFAENRSVNDAQRIAFKHWNNYNTDHQQHARVGSENDFSIVESEHFYIVTRGNILSGSTPGYVLVSIDSNMPEILAFDNSAIFSMENLPEHIHSWIDGYSYMQTLCQDDTKAVQNWMLASATGNEDIEALLGDTEWDQGNPYNALCPVKSGEKTPSGCVATALSQIMKYHQWPTHGIGNIDYYTTTNGFHIICDFSNTIFDWDHIYEQYDEHVCDEATVTPVATLLSAVGAAVRMDYDSDGSGANNSDTYYGMKNYIGYDQDMFLADADNFSDELWHKTIQNELLEGRPVYYTGQGATSGHAFVIDGMKKGVGGVMYYHVNWGWGGLCNGYYLLNMLKPKDVGTGGSYGSNYSHENVMICGLQPEDNISHQRMICKKIALVSKRYFPEQLMQICIESLACLSDEISADVSLTLCSKNDSVDTYELFKLPNQVFNSRKTWHDYYLSCYIPKNISEGQYELRLQCTNNEGKEIEMLIDYPEIEILANTEWYGGENISPKEYLGMSGRAPSIMMADDADFSITIDSLVNLSDYSTKGNISFALTDVEGKLLSVMENKSQISIPGSSVLRNTEVRGTFSSNIPNGYYWLCIVYKPLSDDVFSYIYEMSFTKSIWMSNLTLFSIPFRVKDGVIFIEDCTIQGVDIPWNETGINNVLQSKKSSRIYDINGIKISKPIPQRITILDGRKMIFK